MLLMIDFQNLWNKSAKEYQKYAFAYSQYKKTNEKLIKLANIKDNSIIVDLACGTGITTQEILINNPNIQKIYSLDFSKEMLDTAKNSIQSEKVIFINSDAENIEKVIWEKVDLVVCNSAFWQFKDKKKVILWIYNILKKDGIFIFNLNQQFYDLWETEANQSLIIDTIFSEMNDKWYDFHWKIKEKLGKEQREKLFKDTWFILIKEEIYNLWKRTLEDFFDFLHIPATATFFDKIPLTEQKNILEKSYKKLKTENIEISNNKWVYFILKK